MKKALPVIIVIVIIAGVLVATLGHKKTSPEPTNQNSTSPASTTQTTTNNATNPVQTSSANDVTIQDFTYSPKTLTVKKGTKVTWTNKDSMAHTVTFDDATLTSASSGNMAQGATFSYTFNTTGTFSYHCAYHSNMTASVVVTE